jgi:hypothetical protein
MLLKFGDRLLEKYGNCELIPQEVLEEYRLQLYRTVDAVHLKMYKNETE